MTHRPMQGVKVVELAQFTFTPASGGALTLRVDPTHWLDAVAFDDTGEAPDFSARAPATQLLAGVASGASYVFTWEAR